MAQPSCRQLDELNGRQLAGPPSRCSSGRASGDGPALRGHGRSSDCGGRWSLGIVNGGAPGLRSARRNQANERRRRRVKRPPTGVGMHLGCAGWGDDPGASRARHGWLERRAASRAVCVSLHRLSTRAKLVERTRTEASGTGAQPDRWCVDGDMGVLFCGAGGANVTSGGAIGCGAPN